MQNQKSKVSETARVQWPDLSKDTRAFELAKVALGAEAPLHDLLKRAQEIKETL